MQIFKTLWGAIVSFLLTYKPPVVKPEPGGTSKVTLKDIITTYNQPWSVNYPLTGTQVNAAIFKNDDATNNEVASLIELEAKKNALEETFLAACIMQESRFSPKCFNHNLGHDRLVPSFEHTDWGLCQFAGTYLPEKTGMKGLTQDEMAAKACTAAYAVPEMATLMNAHMNNASAFLASDDLLARNTKSLNSTTLTDAQWLATLFYNRGDADDTVNKAGGRYYVKNLVLDRIKHPYRVATWHDQFNKALATNAVTTKYFGIDHIPFEK